MVVSQNHIKELNEAPLNALSLHAVAKDVSGMPVCKARCLND